jgi:hypothetical protein
VDIMVDREDIMAQVEEVLFMEPKTILLLRQVRVVLGQASRIPLKIV